MIGRTAEGAAGRVRAAETRSVRPRARVAAGAGTLILRTTSHCELAYGWRHILLFVPSPPGDAARTCPARCCSATRRRSQGSSDAYDASLQPYAPPLDSRPRRQRQALRER
jgi:hypothetical protein